MEVTVTQQGHIISNASRSFWKMKFEEDEPGGGGTTASKGSLRQDVNVTWQSDRDVPHRQWRFTIRHHGNL
jgi:hypothetical protein